MKNGAVCRRHAAPFCRRSLCSVSDYLSSLLFSHCWFAMPQDVLQADWQEVWHSPQPPAFTDFAKSLVSSV